MANAKIQPLLEENERLRAQNANLSHRVENNLLIADQKNLERIAELEEALKRLVNVCKPLDRETMNALDIAREALGKLKAVGEQ